MQPAYLHQPDQSLSEPIAPPVRPHPVRLQYCPSTETTSSASAAAQASKSEPSAPPGDEPTRGHTTDKSRIACSHHQPRRKATLTSIFFPFSPSATLIFLSENSSKSHLACSRLPSLSLFSRTHTPHTHRPEARLTPCSTTTPTTTTTTKPHAAIDPDSLVYLLLLSLRQPACILRQGAARPGGASPAPPAPAAPPMEAPAHPHQRPATGHPPQATARRPAIAPLHQQPPRMLLRQAELHRHTVACYY